MNKPTTTLNPSLALVLYTNDGAPGAICFVADLGQDLEPQAASYMMYENLDPAKMIAAYWHNALEDTYDNRYEPVIKQIG